MKEIDIEDEAIIEEQPKVNEPKKRENEVKGHYFPKGFSELDAKERVKRVKGIYESLNTQEDRLRFLFEYGCYRVAARELDKWTNEEELITSDIQSDFINNKFIKGDSNTVYETYRTLAAINMETKLKMLEDVKEYRRDIPEDDPNRLKKAYWLARQKDRNSIIISAIDTLTTIIGQGVDDNVDNTVWNNFYLKKGTTMRDFAEMLGLEGEGYNDFLEDQGAVGMEDAKVYDFYKQKYINENPDGPAPTQARVIANIKSLVGVMLPRKWRMDEEDRVRDKARLLDWEIDILDHIGVNNAGEPSKSGIKDWIEAEGKKKAEEANRNVFQTIVDEFNENRIFPYRAKTEGFEIVDKPVIFNCTCSKYDIATFISSCVPGIAEIFGEHTEEVEEKNREFKEKINALRSKDYYAPLDSVETLAAGGYVRELTDYIKKLRDEMPKDTYRRRTVDMFLRQVDMFANGDFEFLEKAAGDKTITDYSAGTFMSYPVPMVVDKRNPETGSPDTYKCDFDKYEEIMSKHRFLEQMEDKQKFVSEVHIPFLKAKAELKADLKVQKDFKKATYEYLKKQQKNFEELCSIKEEGEILTIQPFAGHPSAISVDWGGQRYGSTRKKRIDSQIKALEHGWSPEDMPLIETVEIIMHEIEMEKNDGNVRPEEYERIKAIHDQFKEGFIDENSDRKKLIDSLNPIYKAYKKLGRQGSEKYLTAFDKLKNNSPMVVHLDPDERMRVDIIHLLEESYEELSAQHTGSLKKHRDTDEMRLLKEKVQTTIEALKTQRNVNIAENQQFSGLLEEISNLAKTYAGEKIKSYKQKEEAKFNETRAAKEADIRAKVNATDLNANQKNRKINEDITIMDRAEREKLAKKLKDWTPSTTMGKRRYASAKSLADRALSYSKELKNLKIARERGTAVIEEVKNAGYQIKHDTEFEYFARFPYERGVDQIINYYGINPAFVPEHCRMPGDQAKMYTKENFLENVKPIDIKGISNEDFAVVAFSSVMDHEKIDVASYKKLHDYHEDFISHRDMVCCNRTMYTLDMAMKTPRANMVEKFFSFTVNSARNDAKDAIEAYQKGDMKKLTDIMVKGIKEITADALHNDTMTFPESGNFNYLAGMLKKTMDFVTRDQKLYSAVYQKLGKDAFDEVNDVLRLKGFVDEAYAAKATLEQAVRDKHHLSEEVKKNCVKAIVREHFITTFHNKVRIENVEDSPVNKQMEAETEKEYREIGKTGHTPDEIQNKMDCVKYSLRQPIPQITTRLRTDKGMKKLDDTVAKYTSKIKVNVFEKDLLKSLDDYKKAMEDNYKKERAKELQRREVESRKQAERLAKQNGGRAKVKHQ
ncbi:MAG: hypothetical protein IKQ71_00310 [Lachnospiraceae bacterium]|nr:hypothetical protein [Lachnospiraceae bacterium]